VHWAEHIQPQRWAALAVCTEVKGKCKINGAGAVGCVAQWAERRSLAGELTLSCTRLAADG